MRRLLVTSIVLVAACGGDGPSPSASGPAPTVEIGAAGWELLPPMPTPRSQFAAGLLGGDVYTAGGLTKPPRGRFVASAAVEVFDTESRTWRAVADLPEARHHLMAVVHDGEFYVFGGLDPATDAPVSTAWRYDPTGNRWSDIVEMPYAVGSGVAVSFEDHIYLIGGVARGRSVYRYDPVQNRWDAMTPMADPTEHLAAATLDGRIYAIGGRWRDDEIATVRVYDVASDEWGEAASLQMARGGFDAVAWAGRIIAVGGELVGTRHTLDSIEVFDPAVGAWAFAEPLPISLEGHRVFVVDATLYVVGGLPLPTNAERFGSVWSLALSEP